MLRTPAPLNGALGIISLQHIKDKNMRVAREEAVDIGGKNCSITSDDDYLERIKNGFEPDMVRLFRAVANDSETILDIGANIGCAALLRGHRFQNSSISFDPCFPFFLRLTVRAI